MRQPHTHGRGRTGRARLRRPRPLYAPDLPATRSGQQSDRAWLQGNGDRPRHAGRGDGAAGARLFLAGIRPVQGRRRAGVDRPWNRPAQLRSMLPRGRAGGLHRHPQGTLGAAAFRLGAQDRAPRRSWSRRAAPGCSVRASRRSTICGVRVVTFAGRGSTPLPSSPCSSPDETAAILFTSGSTGPPKGAVYTHAIFQAQVESFRSLYAIEPGEIDLCTFPLFALFAPALGMTAIVPDMDPTRPARVEPGQDLRGHRRFRRDELVRLAGSAAPARTGRQSPLPAAADLETGHLGGRAGLGEDPGTTGSPARPAGSSLYSLWRDRITAGRIDRQRRGPGRNAATPPTREWAYASAVRSRESKPGSSRSAMIPFPPGPTTCSCPTARSARSSWLGPVVTREYFNRPEATAWPRSPTPRGRRFIIAWATWAIATTREGSGSAGGSRTA